MKKLLILILICFVFNACKLYQFDHIAGVEKNEFPENLRGNYYYIQKNKRVKDTVLICITKNKITSENSNLLKSINLSDSVKISKLNSYYFINVLNFDSSDNKVWQIYPIKIQKSNIYLSVLTKNKNNKSISKYLKTNDNSDVLKMDSNQFLKFCEKKLKRKKSIKFRKI